MGDPKKSRKKYSKPKSPWERSRIDAEKELVKEYGLKNKKEVWRAEATMKKYRGLARGIVGDTSEKGKVKEGEIVNRLIKKGFLKEGNSLDDILSLNVRDILERRLQTLVWKKGLAINTKQARQFITHGHIKVGNKKATAPGMSIDTKTEKEITWVKNPIETIKPGTVTDAESRKKAEAKPIETESAQKVNIIEEEKPPKPEKEVVEKKEEVKKEETKVEEKKEEPKVEEKKPEPVKKETKPKEEVKENV